MLKVVEGARTGQEYGTLGVLALTLDELAREGARRIIAAALDEEVEAYLARYRGLRDGEGHALVVRNGRARARKVTLGSGTIELRALGFWAAVRDVWPETREQRDWVHRLGNVLDKLPKRLQRKAKEALREIMNAPTREAATEGIARFEADYGAKYPKAAESLGRDQEALLAFYDFPAEHWKHIRTTNPIESSFSTVRLRQRVTKGPGSQKRGLVMAFKLLEMAEQRWRRLNGAQLLPLVRAGVRFQDGEQLEREDATEEDTTERAAA